MGGSTWNGKIALKATYAYSGQGPMGKTQSATAEGCGSARIMHAIRPNHAASVANPDEVGQRAARTERYCDEE